MGTRRVLRIGMGILLLVAFLQALMSVGPVRAAPAADFIPSLPGQPKVAFKQFAGYVTVDQERGRNLFYYFVEAATNATNKPLTLWLNGGPGCSSLGGGGFSELGPFYPEKTGKALFLNVNSWNLESNIIFLESPAGVGFSYAENASDYFTDDDKTAHDALIFLLTWLAEYPEYQNRDFYISGESYAGHYVPQLAAAVVKNNKVAGQLKINLVGILVGNPLFSDVIDLTYSPVEYTWSHGMVSEDTHDIILRECKFSPTVPENPTCNDALNEALTIESTVRLPRSYINPYDVLEDICLGGISQQALILKQMHFGKKFSVDPCIGEEETIYLNLPEVQSALHAKNTTWSMCSKLVNYNLSDFNTEIAPVLGGLLEAGLRVWIFSGDADAVVPVIGTRQIINTLAKTMNLNTTTDYLPWFQGKQIGGWSVSWGSLVFSTVRGAGHMVPQTQPLRALQLFSSFLAGTALPANPS